MSERPFTVEGRAATAVQVVLVLPDELLERASAAKHLRSSGFDVIEVADGDEARRILDGTRADVVIADLEILGQANELGLLRWLRERHPAIKTILTSGTETSVAAAMGNGVFLSRPYRMVDLDYCLQRVLAVANIPARQMDENTMAGGGQTGLSLSKALRGSAGTDGRPASVKAEGRGDEIFKLSIAKLLRRLAERAARQRAVDPGPEKMARRTALQTYDRARDRRLRLVLGFVMGTLVGLGIANLVMTVGSPFGATTLTEPVLSVEVATATPVPVRIDQPSPLSSPAAAASIQSDSTARIEPVRAGQPEPGEPTLKQTLLWRDEVREVQARLQSLGFNPGSVDGVAGAKTAGAVMRYQQEKGQLQTGMVDRELLEQLRQDTAPQLAQRVIISDGQAARSRGQRRSDPFQPVWAAANRFGQWLEAQVR
jgi:CheY-like chemotaxis protein